MGGYVCMTPLLTHAPASLAVVVVATLHGAPLSALHMTAQIAK